MPEDNDRMPVTKSGFTPAARTLILVGAYGSGKTEVSVNLAIQLAEEGHPVDLVDLDIANPYFRTREVQDILRRKGVRPVNPPGEAQFSDLPIIVPEVQGLLGPRAKGYSLFDVGGDLSGARVLGSLRDHVTVDSYELFQVINTGRPFASTVSEMLDMKNSLESVSSMKITGYILNSHMMDETDEDMIRTGVRLSEALSDASGIPLVMVCVMESVSGLDKLRAGINYPVMTLTRRMLPPFLKRTGDASWPLLDIYAGETD